ncbi:MAG: DUF1559 domain-containing protein, partial [Planctomycetales bacterium]|nr:DUF1559 domain-containing protein [Planctomycetales bacterium]
MVPPHTSSPGKFQPLSFAVIPSDEPPAAAVEQLRATLENNPQDRVIVTPYGTWYLVRGDMSVPGSTTHNGRKFVLVTNRQDGRVYWEQIRGQIGMQGGMLLFHEDLGERMRVLTRNHIGQHLAFLLDGRVVFAPRISSAINQHAKLTGNLTPDEIRYLVECINGLVTKPLSYAEEGNMGAPPTDARPSSDGTPLPAASTQPYARPLAFAILDPSKPRDDDRKELIQTLEKAPESVRVATGNGTWHRLDDGVTLNDDSLVTIDGKHFVRISNLNDNLIPWQDVQGHIIAVKTSHEDKQSNIELTFDERLATRMLQLTGANLNKQLAILFNDRVVAAPKIFAKVNDKALITGRFDAEEVEKLRLSLMAGQTSNNPQLDMPLSEMSPDDQTTNKSHSISTSDKLRMIGVAMHQYVDAYGRFPASQSYLSTLTSQPFSWRVALLPYLGYQELYDKFHVNEPWDSEHNKALLAEMPDIYRSSHAPDLQPAGWTNMFGFSGDNTVLGKEKGAAMHDITDGTSNTLLVVESASCVEWTKPEDFAFMNAKDVHVVNLVPNQPLSFLMADGGVRHMDLVDWKELAKMVTRAGGE